MKATVPITIGDKVYDHWSLALSISQTLAPSGEEVVSVALRCVPSRATGDPDLPVETLDTHAVAVLRGTEREMNDPVEIRAFAEARAALVTYLRSRGL